MGKKAVEKTTQEELKHFAEEDASKAAAAEAHQHGLDAGKKADVPPKVEEHKEEHKEHPAEHLNEEATAIKGSLTGASEAISATSAVAGENSHAAEEKSMELMKTNVEM